ncbi:MAG: dolichyl-phosphate beta-glucosyltransferase [Patescibacteria group bacterium]
MTPDLSVIIPVYNEAKRFGPHLKSILKYLNKNYPSFELIVVDDGSNDMTAEIIRREKIVKLISYTPNRGKGYAIRTGVAVAKGKLILFMDADLSTPLTEIPKIIKVLGNNDIVIGSRGSGDNVKKNAPLFRRLASFVFDQIKFFMVGLRRFKDTQCGFKIFKGDIAQKLFSQAKIDRFMFDVEILYLAEKSGLKIVELPVTWADVPGSHVRFWEGIINMFRDLWRIRQIHS